MEATAFPGERDVRELAGGSEGAGGPERPAGLPDHIGGEKTRWDGKKHLGLVSFVASRLAIGLPNWIDKRDLINAGVIGLIDAVNNFDPAKGVKFESYATTRIGGAMIDELRSLDWIPRSTRTKSKEIENAIAALIGKLGRFLSDEEIAGKLEWDMDKYYKTIGQEAGTTLLSLDEMVDYSGGEAIRRIDTFPGESRSPLDTIERRELLDNVVKILKSLSEQVGMVMNVSESRVSQIHTTTILKLRDKLRSLYSES